MPAEYYVLVHRPVKSIVTDFIHAFYFHVIVVFVCNDSRVSNVIILNNNELMTSIRLLPQSGNSTSVEAVLSATVTVQAKTEVLQFVAIAQFPACTVTADIAISNFPWRVCHNRVVHALSESDSSPCLDCMVYYNYAGHDFSGWDLPQ